MQFVRDLCFPADRLRPGLFELVFEGGVGMGFAAGDHGANIENIVGDLEFHLSPGLFRQHRTDFPAVALFDR